MACHHTHIDDNDVNCLNHFTVEGGHLGADAYPEPNTAYGDECYCTIANLETDLVDLSTLALTGTYGMPAKANIEIPHLTFTAQVPIDGTVDGTAANWSSDFTGQVPAGGDDYSGTWSAYLSLDDLAAEEPVICEDNPYYASFYWEESPFDPKKGRSIPPETHSWACTAKSPLNRGEFILATMPGAPPRGDGSVSSFFFLADGDPRINGLHPTRFTITDPGDATALEIDGQRFEVKEGAEIVLPEKMELYDKVYLTYAKGGTQAPRLSLEAECSTPSYGASRTPSYAVPSSIGTLFGVDQPALVQITGPDGAQELSVMAIGTGYRRGLRLKADGGFARSGERDGLGLKGRVVRADANGLVVRFDALTLDGLPLLLPGTTLVFPKAG